MSQIEAERSACTIKKSIWVKLDGLQDSQETLQYSSEPRTVSIFIEMVVKTRIYKYPKLHKSIITTTGSVISNNMFAYAMNAIPLPYK